MSTVEAEIKQPAASAARMAAVEILLAEPEALGDDVLEAALYVVPGKAAGRHDRRHAELRSKWVEPGYVKPTGLVRC